MSRLKRDRYAEPKNYGYVGDKNMYPLVNEGVDIFFSGPSIDVTQFVRS